MRLQSGEENRDDNMKFPFLLMLLSVPCALSMHATTSHSNTGKECTEELCSSNQQSMGSIQNSHHGVQKLNSNPTDTTVQKAEALQQSSSPNLNFWMTLLIAALAAALLS
ncbi:uncharacterized protein LOC135398921 [Ornithodoros turicata]|uniref:uncharacterized protein LOC135398921 n=1 Tax=Ornithodoros turicata TaxID=34597 RepID=UPI003138C57F